MILTLAASASSACADEPVLPDRVRDLMQLVDDGHPSQWSIACASLANGGPTARPAVPILLAIAADTRRDAPRRCDALRTAQGLANGDHVVVRTVVSLLSDPDDEVRYTAADQLSKWYAHRPDVAATAAPALITAWRKYRDDAANNLGWTLHAFGPLAAPVTADLLEMLAPPTDPEPAPGAKLSEWDRIVLQSKRSRGVEAQILARIGPSAKAAVPMVTAMLASKHKGERWAAVTALADFGPVARDAIPALKAATQDVDPAVGYRAMYALGRLGCTDVTSLPAFKEPPHPGLTNIRYAYVVGRAVAGPHPVPQLLEAIKSRDPEVRTHAISQAEKLGAAAVPALAKALDHPDWRTRWGAMIVLRKIGADYFSPGAVAAFWARAESRTLEQALIARLQDPAVSLRDHAAMILASAKSGGAFEALSRMARDNDWYDRSTAIVALKEFRGSALAPAALSSIQLALNDPHSWVRYCAARTLANFGPAAAVAVPRLIELTADESISPMEWPAVPPDARPDEIQQFEQSKQGFRRAPSEGALKALAAIGPDARAAVPMLLSRIDDYPCLWFRIPNPDRCRAELQVIESIGPDAAAAIPILLRRLYRGQDKYVITDVIACMGEKGAAALVPLVQPAEATYEFRYSATEAFGRMGRPAAGVIAPLLTDNDWQVRQRAAEILQKMNRRASPAADAIVDYWLHETDRPAFSGYDLVTVGPALLTALTERLTPDAPSHHWRLCEGIALFHADAAPAVPKLIDLLNGPGESSRIAAARAIREIGPPARAALPALKQRVADGSEEESKVAAEAAIAVTRPR